DLAQAVLRKWQEKRNWSFQAYPNRVGLPIGLFSALPSHDVAQEIAEKQYLPDGVDERLDELIRAVDRKKVKISLFPSFPSISSFWRKVALSAAQDWVLRGRIDANLRGSTEEKGGREAGAG